MSLDRPTRSPHPIVKLNFIVRLLGCPMAAMLVVSARVGEATPKWMWVVLAFYAVAWPHVARAISTRSASSRNMEIRLIVFDAMLGGVGIALTSFRAMPTLAFAIGYTTMLASVGGFRLLGMGVPGMMATCLLTGALITGFRVETTNTYLTSGLAGGMLLIFQLMMAIQTYRQARGFVRSRRLVVEQADQIRIQNVALITAREEALQAAQAKAAFLATMSHEIRTPMNGVLGMTRLLAETRLSEDQRDFVRTIQLSGNSLLAIINDILDYSKIESGRMELEEEPVSLIEALEESFEIVAERAREKGVELLYQIAPEVPGTIRGDITRLRQVLTNLVGNAVKFTEHGEVFVDVRLVRAEDAGQPAEIAFDVRDSGIGIPPERIPMLFSAFSQVDASTTRKYGGTGLGLAISKRLTEMMGGEVTVQSTLGKGSSFCFTIQARACPEMNVPAEAMDTVPLAGRRVLIVDDNATNRRVLGEQLAAWGLIAESADTARAAHDALAEKPFNLAVLDLHMPEVDGVMLARQIRERPELRNLPLILLSSSILQKKDDPEGLFTARLTKPIRQSKLFDALMVALAEREGARKEKRPGSDVPRIADVAQLHILVADDNEVNRKLAGLVLRRFGYKADFVANGREALDRVLHGALISSEDAYDLVFMDVHMPEMDGLDATRAIRERAKDKPDGRWPRIVAVTADAMQGDREICIEAGMDDYLTKPLNFEAVQDVLQRVADAKAGRHDDSSAPQTAPAAIDSPALIDWSRLDELREYDTADGEVVKSAVASFVAQVPNSLALVRRSIKQRDPQGLREAAHAIRGAAANVGASSVADLAGQLERTGRSDSFESAGELLDTLSAALDQTVAELHARSLQARSSN